MQGRRPNDDGREREITMGGFRVSTVLEDEGSWQLPLQLLQQLVSSLILLANEANEHHFNTGERSAWICFLCFVAFSQQALRGMSPA